MSSSANERSSSLVLLTGIFFLSLLFLILLILLSRRKIRPVSLEKLRQVVYGLSPEELG